MRISIALEKRARINVNLKEGLDVETFGQLVSILTEKAIKQSNDSLDALESKCHKEVHVDHSHYNHVEKADITTVKNNDPITQSPDEENLSKGLVMVRCPECKKIAVMLLYIKNGQLEYKNKTLNCKNCQADLPITKLQPAYYKCPNCGTTATFYVMGNLREANCKSCGSLIDLVWNDKKKEYVSINLIK